MAAVDQGIHGTDGYVLLSAVTLALISFVFIYIYYIYKITKYFRLIIDKRQQGEDTA